MKALVTLLAFGLVPAAFAAPKNFECFSKYYTANQVTVTISGAIDSDTRISNVKVSDDSDGLKADIDELNADPSYKPRMYKGYNLYSIGNNLGDKNQRGVDLLLPNNIETLSGAFTGYLSDALADTDGSDGYFRLLCKVTR